MGDSVEILSTESTTPVTRADGQAEDVKVVLRFKGIEWHLQNEFKYAYYDDFNEDKNFHRFDF